MTDAVERVARALAEAEGYAYDPVPYDRHARAAILELRIPTPEMIEAGLTLAADCAPHDETGEVSIWHVWTAMIDRALGETK